MDDQKIGVPVQQQNAVWRRWVEAPLVVCGAALVFVLMGLSFSDALLRSLFNMPIFGANDYAQILLSFAVAISCHSVCSLGDLLRSIPLPT